MRLPCRHIFLTRSSAGLSIYDQCLSDDRWSKSFFHDSYYSFTLLFSQPYIPPVGIKTVSSCRPTKAFNHVERYRDAAALCKNLSSLASEAGGSTFIERMQVLKTLETIWRNGQEACILYSSDRSSPKEPSISEEDQSDKLTAVIEPNEAVIEPNEAVIEPNETVIEPNETIIEPNEAVIEPNEAVIKPNETVIEP
eukprot:TCONS_00060343-protein